MMEAVMDPEASAPGRSQNPVVMSMMQDAVDRERGEKSGQPARETAHAQGIADEVPARPDEGGRGEPWQAYQKLG